MILSGLKEMHSKNIIHRDIKPSNILINSAGVVKICDFGLAISLDDKDSEGNFLNEGFTTYNQFIQLVQTA